MVTSEQKISQIIVRSSLMAIFIMLYLVIAIKPAGGEVIGIEGKVQVRPVSGNEFRQARLLDPIPSGAQVRTLEAGKIKILFPPSCIVMMDQDTLLEIKENLSARIIALQVLSGKIRFIVPTGSSVCCLQLQSPTALVEAARVDGILVVDGRDRIICLQGSSGISVKNQHSGQQLMVRPGQTVSSSTEGSLALSRLEAWQAEQLIEQTTLALTKPPPSVLQPPAPARTPVTLADQVNPPWPVFPPVSQIPNLWR